MKKLFSAMSLVLGLGLATAQQTAPATASNTHHQVAKTAKAADTKMAKPAMATTKAADSKMAKQAMATNKMAKPAAPSTTAVKMKKDGTPDKRYKETQHLKKDGTPDKRYKENK